MRRDSRFMSTKQMFGSYFLFRCIFAVVVVDVVHSKCVLMTEQRTEQRDCERERARACTHAHSIQLYSAQYTLPRSDEGIYFNGVCHCAPVKLLHFGAERAAFTVFQSKWLFEKHFERDCYRIRFSMLLTV